MDRCQPAVLRVLVSVAAEASMRDAFGVVAAFLIQRECRHPRGGPKATPNEVSAPQLSDVPRFLEIARQTQRPVMTASAQRAWMRVMRQPAVIAPMARGKKSEP